MSRKKDPSERLVSLSTKVHPDTDARVRELAKEQRTGPAQILREALLFYLEAHPVNGRGSKTAKARKPALRLTEGARSAAVVDLLQSPQFAEKVVRLALAELGENATETAGAQNLVGPERDSNISAGWIGSVRPISRAHTGKNAGPSSRTSRAAA